jgi:hypothetical protein
VQQAIEWGARAITGEGVERWYASGTSGPGFSCAANERQPCACPASGSPCAHAACCALATRVIPAHRFRPQVHVHGWP